MSKQEVKLFQYGRYWEEAFRMAVEKIERARVLLALDQDAAALAELQEPVGKPDIDSPAAPPPGDGGLRDRILAQYDPISTEAVLERSLSMANAQEVDGQWYIPKWGCDQLDHVLDAALGRPAEMRDAVVAGALDAVASFKNDPRLRPPALRRWRCTTCGLEVQDADVTSYTELPASIVLWHRNADGEWCGPVESRKEGEGK